MIFLFTLLAFAHATPECTVREGFGDGKIARTQTECTADAKYLAGYRIGRKSRVLDFEIFTVNQALTITKARQESLRFEITPAQFDLQLGGFYTKKQVAEDYARETSALEQAERHQADLADLAQNIDGQWNKKDSLIQSYHQKWGYSEVDVDRSWKQTLEIAGGFEKLKPASKTVMQAEVKSYGVVGQGLAAIVVGFGTGHALQHRYWRTGWIYTLLDTSSLGLMIAGNDSDKGWFKALGIIGLVTTRVVQAVDVMDRPYISERQLEQLQTETSSRVRPDVALIYLPLLHRTF